MSGAICYLSIWNNRMCHQPITSCSTSKLIIDKKYASFLFCVLLSLFISSQVVLFRLALSLRILFLSFINLAVGRKIPKEDIGAVAKVSLRTI